MENGFTILTATYKNIIGGERTHKIAFSINRPFLGQLFQSYTPVTKEELKKIKSIIDKETAEIEKAKKITELESQLAEFQKKIESEIKKLKTK